MADLKDMLSGLGSSLAKAGKEAARSASINIDIAKEQAALKALYADIGKKICELYNNGESFGAEFDGMAAKASDINMKIADLKDSLKAGKEIAADAESPIPSTARYVTEDNGGGAVVCPACQAKNPAGEKFCLSCGRML